MPNLQAGARLASLSSLPGQATGDAEFAQFPTLRRALDPLEAAFEDDLAMWLAQLYARREEQRLMGQLERVYGVGWLATTVSILAVPLFGVLAVFASVLLLVAMLVLAWKAAIRSLEQSDRAHPVDAPETTAQNGYPMFGPDERAQLVRLMNLSQAAWRPATRMLLRAELREARSCGRLANWRPLYDLEDVVLTDAFASTAMSE
jgi:hypothetical protein